MPFRAEQAIGNLWWSTWTRWEICYGSELNRSRKLGTPLASSTEERRTSSAAEWAVQTSDGDLAVVMDELDGVGLMKLAAPSGTAAPSPAPTVGSRRVDEAATPARAFEVERCQGPGVG